MFFENATPNTSVFRPLFSAACAAKNATAIGAFCALLVADTVGRRPGRCDDLMLIQAQDTDGARIQMAGTYSTSSVGGIGWPQYLTVAQADLDGDRVIESVAVAKKEDAICV